MLLPHVSFETLQISIESTTRITLHFLLGLCLGLFQDNCNGLCSQHRCIHQISIIILLFHLVLHKLSKLSLHGIRPADRGCDALLLVTFQTALFDESLTTCTRISRFGIVLVLHMVITFVCPKEGLVAMWTFDNAAVHRLLVVLQLTLCVEGFRLTLVAMEENAVRSCVLLQLLSCSGSGPMLG